MPVILVIIIMVAWLVILGPNLLKRRSRTVGGINSISHFHRQLRVLEHSGPEPLITPAYRLRTGDGPGAAVQGDGGGLPVAPKLTVVGADRLPRPALAFLGEDPVETGPAGRLAAQPRPDLDPPGPDLVGTTSHAAEADARARTRRRRRDTLGVLTLVFVVTTVAGFIPGAAVVWALSLVSGVALAAYVALLVRLRQRAEERERKLHYLRPGVTNPRTGGLATAGRYAHPSHQAVAR